MHSNLTQFAAGFVPCHFEHLIMQRRARAAASLLRASVFVLRLIFAQSCFNECASIYPLAVTKAASVGYAVRC